MRFDEPAAVAAPVAPPFHILGQGSIWCRTSRPKEGGEETGKGNVRARRSLIPTVLDDTRLVQPRMQSHFFVSSVVRWLKN
ncbi:MAG: hypothetical protein JWR69_2010 [Pedosphaera sp.]|nr:hypothetical protein [Pedosphaera sp.]